jgi:hypothetical protein
VNAARDKLQQRLTDHDAPVLELSKAIVFLTKIDQITSSSSLQQPQPSAADKNKQHTASIRNSRAASGKNGAKNKEASAQDAGSYCMQSQKTAVLGLMQRCFASFSDQIKDLGNTDSVSAGLTSGVSENKDVNDGHNTGGFSDRIDMDSAQRTNARGQDIWEAVGAALEYKEGVAEQKLRAAYESLAMTLCTSLTTILLWHTQVRWLCYSKPLFVLFLEV